MTVNQRIKEARQTIGVSQAKFAKEILVSSGYIAQIELGNRPVNDRIIKLVCSAYNVSEVWLRTGEGSMYIDKSDIRLTHIVNVFEKLRPEFQDYVLEQIDKLLELQEKHDQFAMKNKRTLAKKND